MIEFPFFNMQQLNLDWIIDKIKGMLSFLPDDGTAGQILRRTADGAEWSDETGDSVESVNGKTGAVVLDADDILMNDNSSVEDTVDDLKSAFEDVLSVKTYTDTEEIPVTLQFTDGFCEPSNGQIYNYSNFQYSQKIAVQEGDFISSYDPNETPYYRTVTAYYNNVLQPSKGASQGNTSYTVPSGVDEIILTGYKSQNYSQTTITRQSTKTSSNLKQWPLGYMSVRGDMGSGDTLTLPMENVSHDNITVFTGRVTTFSSLKIGKNISGTPNIVIDGTNVVITNDLNESVTVAHGLTIASDIQVVIETQENMNLKRLVVSSCGEDFVYNSTFRYNYGSGATYATSVGSVLTDCVLSWTCRNINKPIWLFGDSYLSFYPQRWTYYLVQDGYMDSCMINAYAGEGAKDAYAALVNLLSVTVPKIVVWCIGMNNGDSSSAVNSTWKEKYDGVIELSKKYGFELVLYTTPTTPTVNNKFKNAIVRASNYRYVDADGAVKADDNGNWISGTLYSDDTHPTIAGAKIIYHQFLADLPELTAK